MSGPEMVSVPVTLLRDLALIAAPTTVNARLDDRAKYPDLFEPGTPSSNLLANDLQVEHDVRLLTDCSAHPAYRRELSEQLCPRCSEQVAS